jgi:hypothetical protein
MVLHGLPADEGLQNGGAPPLPRNCVVILPGVNLGPTQFGDELASIEPYLLVRRWFGGWRRKPFPFPALTDVSGPLQLLWVHTHSGARLYTEMAVAKVCLAAVRYAAGLEGPFEASPVRIWHQAKSGAPNQVEEVVCLSLRIVEPKRESGTG